MLSSLAGATLVAAAFLEDEPRVVAGPGAHRFVASERRRQAPRAKSPRIRGGQVVQLDPVRLHQREGALDQALQLADVARPRIDSKRLLGLGGQRQVRACGDALRK